MTTNVGSSFTEGLRAAIEQALAEPGVRGHGRRVLALALEAYALRDHSDSGDIAQRLGEAAARGFREGYRIAAARATPDRATLSDIDDLKARLRGQIPDMSPPSRMRWKVDDPTAQYDPLVRLSAVYQVIDEWATPDRADHSDSGDIDAIDVERLRVVLDKYVMPLRGLYIPVEDIAAEYARASTPRTESPDD